MRREPTTPQHTRPDLSLLWSSLTSYRHELHCGTLLEMFPFQQTLFKENRSISFLVNLKQTHIQTSKSSKNC